MCVAFSLFVYIIIVCSSCLFAFVTGQQQVEFKSCEAADNCPDHSLCTRLNNTANCVCWQGYQQNPAWSAAASNLDDTDYCSPNGNGNKTLVIYTRTKPEAVHLAIAIFLVLLGVIVATLLLYFLVVLRPIRRTQAVYQRLKLRHNNHRRLEEFEDIDIDMTFQRDKNEESDA